MKPSPPGRCPSAADGGASSLNPPESSGGGDTPSGRQPFQIRRILFLAACSFFTTCFFFFWHRSLYWDTAQHFVQFRDNLHSINKFGEIAWWFPHVQYGWPSYYYSILGFPHGVSPLFGGLAALFWLLGRAGIVIETYHPVYVVYFGFLTPLVFLFAVNAFVRQFLRSRTAVSFALILAAFSPGVMANVTDIGYLEPASYSLFFGAALLSYVRRPSRRAFLVLGFTCVLLGVACNYAFFFWNVVILPLFLGVFLLLSCWRGVCVRELAARTGLLRWVLCGLLFLAGMLPNLSAYLATREIIKPGIGGQSYALEDFRPGNPLGFFTASLPGFGFEWAPNYRENWSLLPRAEPGVHLSYNYMGLLCVPLMLYGLIFGRAPVRLFLLLVAVGVFGIINLSGSSPWFAWLLALPTPLRSVNHFNDLLFRSGGFIVLLLGAAFGLDEAVKRRHIHHPALLVVFLIVTLLGMIVFVHGFAGKTLQSSTFGFMLLTAFMTATILGWLIITKNRRELHMALRLLLVVTLLDVSTHTFIHIWRVFLPNKKDYRRVEEAPSPLGIGMKDSSDTFYFVNWAMMFRSYHNLVSGGFCLDKLSHFKLFSSAHVNGEIAAESALISTHSFENYHSLAMDAAEQDVPEFKPFFGNPQNEPIGGTLNVRRLTYNEMKLEVNTSRPSLLFIMDAHSRYWKATVNGRRVPIGRALYNFKALPVPEGDSSVVLRYSPPQVKAALFAGYLVFLGMGAACLASFWRPWRRKSPACSTGGKP